MVAARASLSARYASTMGPGIAASTRSDRAGFYEQNKSGAAKPAQQGELGRSRDTQKADQGRVRDEAEEGRQRRLGQAQQDFEDEVAHRQRSDRSPALKRPDQGHLVRVFQISADGQSTSDPAYRPNHRFESLGEVHCGRFALERRVR